MKKYSLLLLAMLPLMNSCYDLDRTPSDEVAAKNFWKTNQENKQGLMGVYQTLQFNDVYGTYFNMDVLGGISMGYDNVSLATIAQKRYDARNSWVVKRFRYLYEGVARANNAIANLQEERFKNPNKEKEIAEAKFLRAFFYSQLLNFFGGVPLYDESTKVEEHYNEMTKPRATAEQTRQFIIADLDAAIASLPESWDKPNNGRVTKDAALALKGKVLLFNKEYDKAATAFQAVVDGGRHQLYPKYADLFTPKGDNSSEMIFAVQNMGGIGSEYGMPLAHYLGSNSTYGWGWNNVMPATSFVDSYEWKDGKPFSWESAKEKYPLLDNTPKMFQAKLSKDGKSVEQYPAAKEQLREMYANRDPRLEATIITPYSYYNGWSKNAPIRSEYVISPKVKEFNGFVRPNKADFCYLYRKFVPEENMGGKITNRDNTPINFPIIRYADVLLMLAECENEMGNQPKAVELINKVRARAGMPGINSGEEWLKANTKEEVFQRIRHERAVEMACEGHSFDDLRRWGMLESLNNKKELNLLGGKMFTRNVDQRDYLWPIPDTEREKYPLEQNPGW